MRLILIIIIFLPSLIYANIKANQLSEIYIEANGNNPYEAKFKAHLQGMQRSLMMIADKIGIDYGDVGQVSPVRLKEAFAVSDIKDEKQKDDSYSATVNYSYDLQAVKELFLDFGNDDLKAKFAEYVIFPIFKQRKINNIWDPNAGWNDRWLENKSQLNDHNLILGINYRDKIKYITPANIYDLNYQDYVEAFWPILFKKVLLVIAEYFTDIDSGNAILSIKYVTIEPKNIKNVAGLEYSINNLKDADNIIKNVIKDTINQYGNSVNAMPNTIEDIEVQLSGENVPDEVMVGHDSTRNIIFKVDIFDENELEQIRTKLNNVREIENFQITSEKQNKFKITISTTHSDAEIAESFYQNGLSFKIYGNIYNLIDIKEGG